MSWQRVDAASFGVIYGAIMVLSILLAIGAQPRDPFETALLLFGSVLAITLAKTFSELVAHAIETGRRQGSDGWRLAWNHSAPTLAVANLPTLFFIAAGFGWLGSDLALLLSQGLCVALLVTLGGRAGWLIGGRAVTALKGGCLAGLAGTALAILKYVVH